MFPFCFLLFAFVICRCALNFNVNSNSFVSCTRECMMVRLWNWNWNSASVAVNACTPHAQAHGQMSQKDDPKATLGTFPPSAVEPKPRAKPPDDAPKPMRVCIDSGLLIVFFTPA